MTGVVSLPCLWRCQCSQAPRHTECSSFMKNPSGILNTQNMVQDIYSESWQVTSAGLDKRVTDVGCTNIARQSGTASHQARPSDGPFESATGLLSTILPPMQEGIYGHRRQMVSGDIYNTESPLQRPTQDIKPCADIPCEKGRMEAITVCSCLVSTLTQQG